MNDIVKAIDALVEQKTFNLDALQAINDLRNKVIGLQKDLDEERQGHRRANESRTLAEDLAEKLQRELKAWADREVALRKREAEADAAKLNAAVADARSSAYVIMFGTIFGPERMKQMITENMPVFVPPHAGGSGYVTTQSGTRNIETEK